MAHLRSKQILGGNPGQILVSDASGSATWNDAISINSDMIEFFELVLAALGYDITYEDFTNMSKEERKSIIRDLKINRVINS